MRRVFLLLLLFSCFVLPLVAAQQGHMTLLTVAESEDPLVEPYGGTADLYLEIRPGNGRIYIDSFPLTRLDTQGSTRYANKVACDYLDAPCDRYDFFYTIRADSTLVGGPSAGAAMAVLTVSLLDNHPINESIVITGTITSGGIIGPVAGVKEKSEAAAAKGMSTLLISGFSSPSELNRSLLKKWNDTNISAEEMNFSLLYSPINLSELPIKVVEVFTLEDALRHFFGQESLPPVAAKIEEDPAYSRIMHRVADALCERHDSLFTLLDEPVNLSQENFSLRRDSASQSSDWYALASYCFSDLLSLRTVQFEALSEDALKAEYFELIDKIAAFEDEQVSSQPTTLAQLETSVIVAERLREAKERLESQDSNLSAETVAFALERLNSAQVWSSFSTMKSPSISLDPLHLRQACSERIMEADEHLKYLEIYLPDEYLDETRLELNRAQQDRTEGRDAECLFTASKAIALSNLMSGSLSVPKEKLDSLIKSKLAAAATVIAHQEEKGFFPIIGYSYYRYASNLAEHDPYSALTFSEYALELSVLDLYFPREKRFHLSPTIPPLLLLFFIGALVGLFIGFLVGRSLTLKKHLPRSRRRNK